ncbi:MAG: helix-turn-helix transcriptional regulator [Bacteroidota bacterium]
MKGSYLGEFQEIVLMVILILKDNAYGVTIQQEIKDRVGRSISRGALHTALVRLEEKGFIHSSMSGAEAVRGGRRKRFYTVTNTGRAAVEEARNLREQLWQAIPTT